MIISQNRESAYKANSDAGFYLYMLEISQTPLLTLKEEKALAKLVKEGDEAAREHMIKANLRLVVKIAMDYKDYGLPILDLINEGNLGLMSAVGKYDPDHNKNAKFSTYAVWWIKQSIKRLLSNTCRTIRVPIHIQDRAYKIRKIREFLVPILSREPSNDEIAEEMCTKTSSVLKTLEASRTTISIDSSLGEEFDGIKIEDAIEDKNTILPNKYIELQELKRDITEALDTILTEREVAVIKYRFGLDGYENMTLEEIGYIFNITRERVRQVQNIALYKIRRSWENRDRMLKDQDHSLHSLVV